MSKNTKIADLINYISVDESGNVVLSTGGQVATQSYVTTAVSNLVNSAPSTLDTLNELATALGNDANFATTVTNSIATKLPLSGGTLTAGNNSGLKIKQGNQIGDSVTNLNFYNGLVFENVSTTNAYSLGYSQGAKFSLNYFDSNSTYSRLLTVTNGGSFGFGVVNPVEGIHIGGSKHIAFTEAGFDNTRVHKIVHAHADASDANNYFSIQVSNGTGVTSEVMRLTGQKFVGIGNLIPERGLDIDLTGGGAALRIRKSSANLIFLGTGSSSTSAGTENAILQMHHNGDERIRLYTEGNSWIKGGFLGVGTSTPTHLLSLYGATQADIKFQNSGATRAYIWANSGELAFNSLTSNPIKFFINDTEMVRFRADGFAQFGPNSNTLIYSAGNSGTIYMYESGTARIYFEANGSVIFNNTNGVMINNTTPVGRLHVAGGLAISNNNQTFRRALLNFGQTGNYSQVKVIFNKNNWGSVTYDIKLASAGGSYHTAGAYYSNPGFSSHVTSIAAGVGVSYTLVADSQTGSTQGAIWTFSGATMIHPMVTIDIACGNGYQIDPNDIVVQFI